MNGDAVSSLPTISDTFASPLFRKHAPIAANSSFQALAEEDGYVLGQGRKRTRFSRDSGSWRYLDRSPSPVKRTNVEIEHEISGADADGHQELRPIEIGDTQQEIRDAVDLLPVEDAESQTMNQHMESEARIPQKQVPEFAIPALPPPRVDQPTTPPSAPALGHEQEESAATTPRLMPLASPGLPLVSPLIKQPEQMGSYFLPFAEPPSELDASAVFHPDGEIAQDRSFTESVQQEQTSFDHGDHMRMLHLEYGGIQFNESTKVTEEGIDIFQGSYPPLGEPSGHAMTSKPNETQGTATQSDDEVEIVSVKVNETPMYHIHEQEGFQRPLHVDVDSYDATYEQRRREEELDMYGASDNENPHEALDVPRANIHDVMTPVTEENAPDQSQNLLEGTIPQDKDVHLPEVASSITTSDEPNVTRRWSQDWQNKLIISANECLHDDVQMSPPPFPFTQRWDRQAGNEIKRRDSTETRRRSHRDSYDGSADEDESDEESEILDDAEAPESPIHWTRPSETVRDPHATDKVEATSPPTVLSDSVSSGSDSDDIEILSVSQQFPVQKQEENVDLGLTSADAQRDEVEFERSGNAFESQEIIAESVISSDAENVTQIPLLIDQSKPKVEQVTAERSSFSSEQRLVAQYSVQLEEPVDIEESPEAIQEVSIEHSSSIEESIAAQQGQHSDVSESLEKDREENLSSPISTHDASHPREQLATPLTSQQELADMDIRASKELGQTNPLTPQATQSFEEIPVLLPSVAELDGADDVDKHSRERRRSPRLVRREERASLVSSWFTPRKSIETSTSISIEKQEVAAEELPSQVVKDYTEGAHSPSLQTEAEKPTIQLLEESKAKEVSKDSKATLPIKQILESSYTDWPPGLRTTLSYFPSLSGLSSYYNQQVDVIGLCISSSTAPKRAPSGPKDYYTTLHLSDPIISGLHRPHENDLQTVTTVQATSVQIFRPWQNALPATKNGDVVLLRGFKVQSRKREMMLLSTEGSGWAVFSADGNEENISGPPVEYGNEEKDYVVRLQSWWRDVHSIKSDDNDDQTTTQPKTEMEPTPNPKPQAKGHSRHSSRLSQPESDAPSKTEEQEVVQESNASPDTPLEKPEDSAPVYHELRDGVKYVDPKAGHPAPTYHELRDGVKYVDTTNETPHRHTRSRSQKNLAVEEGVHELRDGVRWTDK